MRNVLAVLSVLLLSGVNSLSQSTTDVAGADSAGSTDAVSSAEAPAPAAAPVIEDANAVRAEVIAVKQRRAEEEAELRTQLQDAELEFKELQAREKQLQDEIPKIDLAIADYKKRMDETYQMMTDAETPYKAAEKLAKQKFTTSIVAELQARYDEEFKRVMEKHVADTNLVAINRIRTADFDSLELAVDAEDPAHVIRFEGRNQNKVSGWFPTMDFELGKKVWHPVPPNATFEPAAQKRNPFVSDVLLRLGSDLLRCGSTNMLDWDIHLFVGKDFSKKDGDKDKFIFIGVSWPVDLGRPVCWQCGVPPVYDVTPRPERAIADEATPDIAKKLAEWTFEDEGWKRRKNDSVLAYKAAKLNYDRAVILRTTAVERIGRKLTENKDKQKDAEQTIVDIKGKLEEYAEEVPEGSTPPPTAETGAAPPTTEAGAENPTTETGATTPAPQEGL